MTRWLVRPYVVEDRGAVRRICHATGYMGETAQWYWSDQESFADMWTGYYTDVEPESALVGEIGGQVVGYLLGCVDSRRAWNPGVVALRHTLRGGLLWRPGTAATIWRTVWDLVADTSRGRRLVRKPFSDRRWPSHLHINLLPEARGDGLGAALIETWLDRLRALGSPGCSLETLAENSSARAFFAAVGFTPLGEPLLVPGGRTREGGRLHSQVMVRDLSS